MVQEILMTEEGYEDLKRELEELKDVKRKDIAEKIKTARGFGDLSENSEYDEAKNEQAIVEARIQTLEEYLKKVKLLEKDKLSRDEVSMGAVVKIVDVDYNEEYTYRIVSSVESNQSMDTITDESPVGKALLGHKTGDVVEVAAPSGSFRIKILEIGV